MRKNKEIEGVYLKTKMTTIGTGATQKRVQTKIFCRATEIGNGQVKVCYLRFDGGPSGILEVLERDTFLKGFVHYSKELRKQANPENRAIEKHIAMAEHHCQKREYFAAEYEYDNALRLDEENVRATFGKGLALMERGSHGKAREVFGNLARIKALFLEENKHLFNEFGIRLRKLGMYDEAVKHYQKAITICPDDEHLYFNSGRALFEKRKIKEAKRWVRMALRANPDFQEAQDFLRRIEREYPGGPSISLRHTPKKRSPTPVAKRIKRTG